MAYSTISKSSSYFNTKLWTGNSTNSTAITGVGFQPDMTWIKNRSQNDNHNLFDAIRGATYRIYPDDNSGQDQATNSLASFDSDGFTLNDGGPVNGNGENIVGWNWKANGSGSANSDGSINSTVSVNTTSGFSIVQYTGNAVSGATVGHGLGVAPKMIIVKETSGTGDWIVYHASIGNTKRLRLNTTAAEETNAFWYDTTPTSSVWYMNDNGDGNGSGSTYIAYCFAETNGFSKFSSFTGNGEPNNDNPFIYTGFKPSFVMLKVTNTTDSWNMYDNRRDGYNGTGGRLRADTNNTEDTGTDYQTCDFYANGFSPKGNDTTSNGNGRPYIYMAFGQPIVSTNGDIATAR